MYVVLGASGGLGSAVVWQLVRQGKRVRAVSRSADRFELGDLGYRVEVVRGEALGQIWHIPSAETLTTRQFLDLIFAEAQHTPKLRIASPLMLNFLGLFSQMMRELKEINYEFEEPFVVDRQKYERVFGNDTTPHHEAIRKTIS
jgi:NAD(P)-dependent dehydrogenase (short-subunit alcohol dehydrogenase family)